jgi:hypothetical protein
LVKKWEKLKKKVLLIWINVLELLLMIGMKEKLNILLALIDKNDFLKELEKEKKEKMDLDK